LRFAKITRVREARGIRCPYLWLRERAGTDESSVVCQSPLRALEAKDAGVWVFGGGLHSHEEVSVVSTDGTVTDGPYPESKAYIGGFSVVDVPSREEALEWAGRIAVACRCAQEVREFVPGSTP
jgi:hypothetical protein